MSHFYSSCQGGRGKATRCGHKSTGIHAMARSHELTIDISGRYIANTDVELFDVLVTLDDDRLSVGKVPTEGQYRMSEKNPEHGLIHRPLQVVVDTSNMRVGIIHNVAGFQMHNVCASQSTFLPELNGYIGEGSILT